MCREEMTRKRKKTGESQSDCMSARTINVSSSFCLVFFLTLNNEKSIFKVLAMLSLLIVLC